MQVLVLALWFCVLRCLWKITLIVTFGGHPQKENKHFFKASWSHGANGNGLRPWQPGIRKSGWCLKLKRKCQALTPFEVGKQSGFKTTLILDENHWFLKHSRATMNLSDLPRIIAPRVGYISRQHTKQSGRGNTPQGPQLLLLMAVFPSGLRCFSVCGCRFLGLFLVLGSKFSHSLECHLERFWGPAWISGKKEFCD